MGVTDRLTCGIHGRVTGICHLCADERHNRDLTAALAAKERAENALLSINEIRNSIIGTQTMNWSEHVYPLVEALNSAGFEGMPYDEARGKFGTMLERTRKAKSERDALAAKLAEAEGAIDASARVLAAAEHGPWRCFHCGEVFSTTKSAAEHFGVSELQAPACAIDIAEYRAMEERVRRYNEEDSDLHREIARRESEHEAALQREEEVGYAKGLKDGRAALAEDDGIGWQPIETAPTTGLKVILAYVNRNGKPRTVMGRWLTDEEAAEIDADDVGLEGGWYECIDNWDDYTEVAIHEGKPTHWMPLPAPPAVAEKETG